MILKKLILVSYPLKTETGSNMLKNQRKQNTFWPITGGIREIILIEMNSIVSFLLSSYFRLRRPVKNSTSPAVKNIASKNSWWRISSRSNNLPLTRRWWRKINKPTRMKMKPIVLVIIFSIFRQSEILEFIYKNSGLVNL